MAAGLFGAIGYDMIRLVERLPDVNPDPLGPARRGDDRAPRSWPIFDAIAPGDHPGDPGPAGRRPRPRDAYAAGRERLTDAVSPT